MNPQTATERGVNPYAPGQIGAARAEAPPSPYDPLAKGLDGDILDGLLKGRWMEGRDVGREEGHLAAQTRYAPIYDDAFASGQATGAAETYRHLVSQFLPVIQQVAGGLAEIAGKTGSAEIRERANSQIVRLKELLEAHVGQVAAADEAEMQSAGQQA